MATEANAERQRVSGVVVVVADVVLVVDAVVAVQVVVTVTAATNI